MQQDLLTGFDLRKEPDCHHGVWPARPSGEIKLESPPAWKQEQSALWADMRFVKKFTRPKILG